MRTFEKGDRVQYVGDLTPDLLGRRGTVHSSKSGVIVVNWDHRGEDGRECHLPRSLARLAPSPTLTDEMLRPGAVFEFTVRAITVRPGRVAVLNRGIILDDVNEMGTDFRLITPAPEPTLPLPTEPGTRFWGQVSDYMGWLFVTGAGDERYYTSAQAVDGGWRAWLHRAEDVTALPEPTAESAAAPPY